MTNLPATLSTLNQEISALTEKLAPAATDHVKESISSLIRAGLLFPSSIKAEDAPMVYGFALTNISTHGLRHAVTKLIRGEYEYINRAFIPLPPELAAMARAETRLIVEDLSRLKARRAAMVPPEPEKRDEAMIARVRALRMQHKEQHAARKAVATIPQEPMTDEKAEYYRRIMSLRDAPDITAEQAAYRRKIAGDMPDEERQAAE